ncbi:hypothetical protein B6U99_01410 [Candidatus Geothermarchaeota archaeon ex4572_27]|nr:MAG: hypothetical protein B6U99_01410 [Candidatus Geothermarchaeota archaeon ex4572_27]
MITAIMLRGIIGYLRGLGPRYVKRVRSSIAGALVLTLSCEGGDIDIFVHPRRSVFAPTYRVSERTPLSGRRIRLRSLVENARVLGIEQPGMERAVVFRLAQGGRGLNLVFELFGRGNVMVADESWRVEYVDEPLEARGRKVVEGERYQPPAPRGLPVEEALDADRLLSGASSLADLYRLLPLDKYTVRHLIREAGLSEPPTRDGIERLVKALKSLLEAVEGKCKVYLVRVDEGVLMLPYRPEGLEILYESDDLLEASTKYLSEYVIPALASEEGRREAERLRGRLRALLEQRRKVEEEIGRLEALVVKLYQNLPVISQALEAARSGRHEGYGHVIVGVSPKDRTAIIRVDGENVRLRYDVSVYEAIGEVYNRIKRLKAGLEEVERRIREVEERIREAERPRVGIEEVWLLKRRREWYERFKWFYTSGGVLVVAGKDATTNEVLVKRYAKEGDIIMHADVHGSPFTVIKSGGREVGGEDLEEAAVFTASHSNAWKAGFSAADVYWVRPEQVSKKAPSGEYLAKGSFMIYGKRNYIRGARLELYVGLAWRSGYPVVMIAPRRAVEKHCSVTIARLVPGSVERGEVARRILGAVEGLLGRELARPDREYLYSDIVERLPPGPCDIEFQEQMCGKI